MEIDKNNLPVMEMFYSLQGEGYHSGSAAFFIRIGGCDVGCHWCDVKDSWDHGNHDIPVSYTHLTLPTTVIV